MAGPEYVKMSGVERYYGQKNFLQSELELLHLVKGFKEYKKLRQEELMLKVSLKSKFSEVLELIKKLEKQLPKTGYKPMVERKKYEGVGKKKMNLSLQEEIIEVQEKLRKLQEGM